MYSFLNVISRAESWDFPRADRCMYVSYSAVRCPGYIK